MKKRINVDSNLDFIKEKELQRFVDFIENSQHKIEQVFSQSEVKDVIEELVENYGFNESNKVLVVDSGKGEFLEAFANLKIPVKGIAFSDEEFNVCKEKGFQIYKSDQSFLDFEDSSFDLVFVAGINESSFTPHFTFSQYQRVLKVNGLLYFYKLKNELYNKSFLKKLSTNLVYKDRYKLKIEVNDNLNDDSLLLKKEDRNSGKSSKIILALSKGENFGWGVCSKYLNQEVSKIAETVIWDFEKDKNEKRQFSGKVVHALTGLEFKSITNIRGIENYGYTFFENELNENSKKNSRNFDLILGGSTWCMKKMRDYGIENVDLLIQGIDPKKFYPIEEEKNDDMFVIFSGGKFEYRKGQDLVLKAIKILQQKYPDIVLINAWFNMWPKSMILMQKSKHIDFDLKGNNWTDVMSHIYDINDLDQSKIITHEIIPNEKLRSIYKLTDMALFPNRCEGGTNLVMMEYMACGKPVVASYNSGHIDILTDENSLPLKEMKDARIYDEDGNLWADWTEPTVEEIVEKIEFGYLNRKKLREIGKQAGEDLKKFTWADSARSLVELIS